MKSSRTGAQPATHRRRDLALHAFLTPTPTLSISSATRLPAASRSCADVPLTKQRDAHRIQQSLLQVYIFVFRFYSSIVHLAVPRWIYADCPGVSKESCFTTKTLKFLFCTSASRFFNQVHCTIKGLELGIDLFFVKFVIHLLSVELRQV